jgi:hypothetical protein
MCLCDRGLSSASEISWSDLDPAATTEIDGFKIKLKNQVRVDDWTSPSCRFLGRVACSKGLPDPDVADARYTIWTYVLRANKGGEGGGGEGRERGGR